MARHVRPWTETEKEIMREAVSKFGIDWSNVARLVGTRSIQACRERAMRTLFKNDRRKDAKLLFMLQEYK